MIAIIDYGSGNIRSVQNALKRLGYSSVLSASPELIQNADKVLFPGVGHAGPALQSLQESGLGALIPKLNQPVLGICLGMQLLCSSSEESPLPALKVLAPRVKRLPESCIAPHMGWNTVQLQEQNPLFKGLGKEQDFYFVHSYYAETGPETIASCRYNALGFSAGLNLQNFYALQFHPEKSGDAGAQLLQNFIDL